MKSKNVTRKKILFIVLGVILFIGISCFYSVISNSATEKYDSNNENGEICNDIVKINKSTIVYEKPSVIYNEITTLGFNSIVRRINKGVNEINGHVWDKIVLSNGQEGYIFSENLVTAEESEYSNISFECKDIKYNVYFTTKTFNPENYPYYAITELESKSQMIIYYGKKRVTTSGYGEDTTRQLAIMNAAYSITVEKNGRVTIQYENKNVFFFVEKAAAPSNYAVCIASNHDIFSKDLNKKVFSKNSGYEYDASHENEKSCNEIVKVNKSTIVYEKPSVIYNEKVTLVEKSIVRRINKGINEINGHVWDKIILANGKEGYVSSDNLEVSNQNEYSKVSFEYNAFGVYARKYEVYIPTLSYDINIQDYPHYIIVLDNSSKIKICYSATEFGVTTQDENYRIGNQDYVLMIDIENSGRILVKKNIDLASSENSILIKKEDFQHNCIATNQDIYYNDDKIFVPCIYDESGICYKVNTNWENILTSENINEAIRQEEEMYNTMSFGEHIIADPRLTAVKLACLSGLYIYEAKYPNAATALRYYLTSGNDGKTDKTYQYEEDVYNEGHTMRRISLKDALEESNSMKKKLENNIKNNIKIAEQLEISEPVTFVNIIEDSGEAIEGDWKATMHFYRIKMHCTVIKVENRYQMNMKYGIVDYYDWDNKPVDEYETLFNTKVEVDDKIFTILPQDLFLMHRAGMARNYTNYGDTNYKITWNKGAINQYKIEEIIN